MYKCFVRHRIHARQADSFPGKTLFIRIYNCVAQVGTLEYMAPEVLLKEPTTFASDVYAWAVTVNELATGVFPFADCTKDNPQCQTILNFGYGRCY